MKKMRLTGLVALLAGTGLIAACGNPGLLLGGSSNLSGSSAAEDASEQESSIHDLAEHWCETCPVPDGGATELSAHLTPVSGGYTGGPLELALVLSDPAGVVDTAGNYRVARVFSLNDFDFVAGLPAAAWKVSADRTRVRVVVNGELSAGNYVAEGEITDGTASAQDTALYTVTEDHEPTPTPEASHSPEPSPTGTHTEPSPSPTPTGDHSPTPTPTPSGV